MKEKARRFHTLTVQQCLKSLELGEDGETQPSFEWWEPSILPLLTINFSMRTVLTVYEIDD